MNPDPSAPDAGAGRYVLDSRRYDAVIFDMDGVVTRTADVHAAAWKRLFDDFLAHRAQGGDFEPFDIVRDYRRYVDGKPRYDGVRDFLASRDIHLPEGSADDPPGRATVAALGNRKDQFFLAALHEHGAAAFRSTVDLIGKLRGHGLRVAVISASRNARAVLESAGVIDLFETRVDGVVAADLKLPGKPDPAVFLEAARRLGTEPGRAVVVEDATAGVEAGHRGGFGLVIGVDRAGQAQALRQSGADVVVGDLGQVDVA
jgi:beta-phosphoglucomutase family hydrolase